MTHKPHLLAVTLTLALGLLLPSCSLPPSPSSFAGPSPYPVPQPTGMPSAMVTFTVHPPADDTPDDAGLMLVLLDEVTGLAYNRQPVPMVRQPDGSWQASITPAVGSLLRYRYARSNPSAVDEVAADGTPVRLRQALISGPMQLDDYVAAWAGNSYQGPTGRIVGHITGAGSGQPLAEMLVSAGGRLTFTDGEGAFRLDGLMPGLHTLTVASTDGAYHTVQQGAVIAADSATPADLAMQPAKAVQATFEVVLPSDTVSGTPVRVAGNIRQFGNVFADLQGGVSLATGRMPAMVMVDPTHYLMISTLYAGTDLVYKYTLGDGLWNAERNPQGYFNLRRLIVPDHDLVIEDTVSTWHSPSRGSLTFHVTVPADTPPSDSVSLQLNPFTWFVPVPMWRTSDNEWGYELHGPLDFAGNLAYRFCRNQQCGAADDADTAGPDAPGLNVTLSQAAQDLQAQVKAWQWWAAPTSETTVVAPQIEPRPGFLAGIAFDPDYHPSWSGLQAGALADIAGGGANAVILAPRWTAANSLGLPILSFDPARSPFGDELRGDISEAHSQHLSVTLRPVLATPDSSLPRWWADAQRDATWWSVWFERYREFLLTEARLAGETGVERMIIDGTQLAPAFPGGSLQDGSPSMVPADAEVRWRGILTDVRSLFPGKLDLALDFGQQLQMPPAFIDAFDEVVIDWHAPIGSGSSPAVSDMQIEAGRLMDSTLSGNPALAGKPVILNVEYLSVTGSASGCPSAPDQSCRPAQAFAQGAAVDPDLKVDLPGQAAAYNAMLLEATTRQNIIGFFSSGYNPAAALQDKSASVNGKPARDVLWYWYPRLTGSGG
jgi:hypothetical protein